MPDIILRSDTLGTIFLRRALSLAGVTRDSFGARLGLCPVSLFRTSDNFDIANSTSDTLGNYSFSVPSTANYFVVATKPSPTIDSDLIKIDSTSVTIDQAQVEGVTINTLVGV